MKVWRCDIAVMTRTISIIMATNDRAFAKKTFGCANIHEETDNEITKIALDDIGVVFIDTGAGFKRSKFGK